MTRISTYHSYKNCTINHISIRAFRFSPRWPLWLPPSRNAKPCSLLQNLRTFPRNLLASFSERKIQMPGNGNIQSHFCFSKSENVRIFYQVRRWKYGVTILGLSLAWLNYTEKYNAMFKLNLLCPDPCVPFLNGVFSFQTSCENQLSVPSCPSVCSHQTEHLQANFKFAFFLKLFDTFRLWIKSCTIRDSFHKDLLTLINRLDCST
jgi:hypothetical protein